MILTDEGRALLAEWSTVEHTLSLTTETRRKQLSWDRTDWVPRYRWTCSCGWRTRWRDHDVLTWQTARQHALSGQLSAELF